MTKINLLKITYDVTCIVLAATLAACCVIIFYAIIFGIAGGGLYLMQHTFANNNRYVFYIGMVLVFFLMFIKPTLLGVYLLHKLPPSKELFNNQKDER